MLMNTLLTGVVSRDQIATGYKSDIIRRCLQIDRVARYQSVHKLKSALLGKTAWQRFLPPGFRSGNALHMIIALLIYSTLAAGLSGIYDTDTEKGTNPWIDCIGIGIGFIATIVGAKS